MGLLAFIIPLLLILKVSLEDKNRSLVKKWFFSQPATVTHCLGLTQLSLMGYVLQGPQCLTPEGKMASGYKQLFQEFCTNFIQNMTPKILVPALQKVSVHKAWEVSYLEFFFFNGSQWR